MMWLSSLRWQMTQLLNVPQRPALNDQRGCESTRGGKYSYSMDRHARRLRKKAACLHYAIGVPTVSQRVRSTFRSNSAPESAKDTPMPINTQAGPRSVAPANERDSEDASLVAEVESYLRRQPQPRTAVMNEHEAAEYIGCSVSWLRNNRRSPATPPFVKVGKNVRYRIGSLDTWLEQQEVKH